MPSFAASNGAVRRARGFARYAVSVQYHGGSFLGFTYQGPNGEDCIVPQRRKSGKRGHVDLRGHRSVEGRLREALNDLFGNQQWENIQVSSRTDRGVHALKNTFHVDIMMPDNDNSNKNNNSNSNKDDNEHHHGNTGAAPHDRDRDGIARKLRDGLNFYLARQRHGSDPNDPKTKQNPMMNELRILDAAKSPETMDNPYALTTAGRAQNQTIEVDWNARFSATQRTYVYRLLCYHPKTNHTNNSNTTNNDSSIEAEQHDYESSAPHDFGVQPYDLPFEWDRAWCLPHHHHHPLDLEAMKEAAEHLVGTHDFSSFRGKLCQRHSPIVTMNFVTIEYHGNSRCSIRGGSGTDAARQPQQQLLTITFSANSFLYRQVRNMWGVWWKSENTGVA